MIVSAAFGGATLAINALNAMPRYQRFFPYCSSHSLLFDRAASSMENARCVSAIPVTGPCMICNAYGLPYAADAPSVIRTPAIIPQRTFSNMIATSAVWPAPVTRPGLPRHSAWPAPSLGTTLAGLPRRRCPKRRLSRSSGSVVWLSRLARSRGSVVWLDCRGGIEYLNKCTEKLHR